MSEEAHSCSDCSIEICGCNCNLLEDGKYLASHYDTSDSETGDSLWELDEYINNHGYKKISRSEILCEHCCAQTYLSAEDISAESLPIQLNRGVTVGLSVDASEVMISNERMFKHIATSVRFRAEMKDVPLGCALKIDSWCILFYSLSIFQGVKTSQQVLSVKRKRKALRNSCSDTGFYTPDLYIVPAYDREIPLYIDFRTIGLNTSYESDSNPASVLNLKLSIVELNTLRSSSAYNLFQDGMQAPSQTLSASTNNTTTSTQSQRSISFSAPSDAPYFRSSSEEDELSSEIEFVPPLLPSKSIADRVKSTEAKRPLSVTVPKSLSETSTNSRKKSSSWRSNETSKKGRLRVSTEFEDVQPALKSLSTSDDIPLRSPSSMRRRRHRKTGSVQFSGQKHITRVPTEYKTPETSKQYPTALQRATESIKAQRAETHHRFTPDQVAQLKKFIRNLANKHNLTYSGLLDLAIGKFFKRDIPGYIEEFINWFVSKRWINPGNGKPWTVMHVCTDRKFLLPIIEDLYSVHIHYGPALRL